MPAGAPRTLPLALLLAGDGSYERPLFLDSNDMLVRTVPASKGLSRFIDAEWLEFVAEFKFTALLMPNGTMKITGIPFEIDNYQTDNQITDESIKVKGVECFICETYYCSKFSF